MPYPYQNYFQQFPQQYQPQQYQQPQHNGMIWVGSALEAQNYLMTPNSAVTLWDSNSPTVYLKQTDASGKPSMKIYDLVERVQKPLEAAETQMDKYVTRSEFDALAAKIEGLSAKKIKVKQQQETEE